jgi:hypothetical protein
MVKNAQIITHISMSTENAALFFVMFISAAFLTVEKMATPINKKVMRIATVVMIDGEGVLTGTGAAARRTPAAIDAEARAMVTEIATAAAALMAETKTSQVGMKSAATTTAIPDARAADLKLPVQYRVIP